MGHSSLNTNTTKQLNETVKPNFIHIVSVKIEVVSRCFAETQSLSLKTSNRKTLLLRKNLKQDRANMGKGSCRLGKIGGGWTKDRVTEICMPLIHI